MTQTGEQQFSTGATEDPEKDKDFYEGRDPFDETIEHVFATTSIFYEGANEYEDSEEAELEEEKDSIWDEI